MRAVRNSGAVLLALLPAVFGSGPAAAQRGAVWTAPVELAVVPWVGPRDAPRPYRYVVVVSAMASVDIVADARLVGLEITVPGRRRPHRCAAPGRPRRVEESSIRGLSPGERWATWIDLREFCWGRALDALEAAAAGTTLRATYTLGAGRRNWVARSRGEESVSTVRALAAVGVELPRVSGPSTSGAVADARIAVAPTDIRRGAPTFRVSVHGAGATRRVWLRPDRVRFRVVGPGGTAFSCELRRSGARAIPDLFGRISARRAVRLSLDARAYCGDEAFAEPGIYEVTPILNLDEDGEEWGLDAVVGTFVGEAAAVRVRGGVMERAVSAEALRDVLRLLSGRGGATR